MARLWDLLHRFKADWRLAVPVLVICAVAMAYGWYYYWDVGQFDPASPYYVDWWWWGLVADSPNAVLLYFMAVGLYLWRGWRHPLLDSAAFLLNLYVGLWTSFLFLAYAPQMGTWEWGGTNNLLFFSHLGMPLLALVLARDLRTDRITWPWAVGLAAAAALYVWLDYWGPHLHPAPFLHDTADDTLLHTVSPWLMVGAFAAWLVVAWPGLRRDRARRDGPP